MATRSFYLLIISMRERLRKIEETLKGWDLGISLDEPTQCWSESSPGITTADHLTLTKTAHPLFQCRRWVSQLWHLKDCCDLVIFGNPGQLYFRQRDIINGSGAAIPRASSHAARSLTCTGTIRLFFPSFTSLQREGNAVDCFPCRGTAAHLASLPHGPTERGNVETHGAPIYHRSL